VWCRGAGFFYFQAECSGGEATVKTKDNISKIKKITKIYLMRDNHG